MHSPCSQVTVLSQVSGNSSAFAFRQRDISRSTILVEKKLRTIVRYPPLSLSLSLIYRVMCNRIKRGEGGGFISIPRRVDFHSFRRIIHGAVSLFPQRYILNSFNLRTVYFHDLWPRSFPILLFYTNIKIIFHDIYWISTSSKKLGRNKNISFLRFIETVVQLRNRKKLG